MLAADAIVVGTVSEVGNDFLINIRLVDVEKAVILAAASTNMKIKKKDFFAEAGAYFKTGDRDRVQYNLDALDAAIHMYSQMKSPEHLKVVWPSSLKALVPDSLERIPDSGEGKSSGTPLRN